MTFYIRNTYNNIIRDPLNMLSSNDLIIFLVII